MSENRGRSEQTNSMKSADPTFVQAAKKDKDSRSPILQESFLKQLTGSPGRGQGVPQSRLSKASPISKSKGPIAAGDVLSKEQTAPASLDALSPWSQPGLPSSSMHPSGPSWPSAPAAKSSTPLVDTNLLEPPALVNAPSLLDLEKTPESTDMMDQFRRVVYPPKEGTPHSDISQPEIAERTSVTEMTSSFSEEKKPKKKSLFDSFSEDADASFTGIDPIPAYLRAAVNNASRASDTSFSAVTRQKKLKEITSSFRTARSIHLQPLAPQKAPAPMRAPRQVRRQTQPVMSHFPLQMPAYGHAVAGNVFMYRPRIPSLRWVKVDDSAFRINELTEQLEEYAPWIVSFLFLIAGFLATFILFSI